MNESELLVRIQTVTGQCNRELLARFWLQMDARPTLLPFTFDDLRHLNADGRTIFHAILGSYASQQFAPLSARLLRQLGDIIAKSRYREAILPVAVQRAFYYAPGLQPDQARQQLVRKREKA